ncbi:MAG TPA: hypothetical protein VFP10_02140 [Candidatus Eisenbacteria bacterium]|nr:hypothetical protein [Candidatus Eisenbacteria bacterium]
MTDPAKTNGPNGDGSGVINRESKFGQATTVLVSGVLFAVADALGSIDVSALPDWIESTVATAIAAVVGLLVAKATKNRRTTSQPFRASRTEH